MKNKSHRLQLYKFIWHSKKRHSQNINSMSNPKISRHRRRRIEFVICRTSHRRSTFEWIFFRCLVYVISWPKYPFGIWPSEKCLLRFSVFGNSLKNLLTPQKNVCPWNSRSCSYAWGYSILRMSAKNPKLRINRIQLKNF